MRQTGREGNRLHVPGPWTRMASCDSITVAATDIPDEGEDHG